MKKISILIMNLSLYISVALNAQHGYSSASLAMGEMRSGQFQAPHPSEIIIEEYYNYHTHQIPLPRKGEAVNLDIRWGNNKVISNSQEVYLQIGITTPHISTQEAPPVNISLVIDKSGSMSSDNRMHYAREAAKEFVRQLRPQDRISIVAFDHSINTILPSQLVGTNPSNILQTIDRIQPGGSTNLNDGLLMGYRQVHNYYQNRQSNRVIMLTDALTNTGQINPSAIVQNSKRYTDNMDIDITVIGVGVQFNNGLSRQITQSAKSSIHFINHAKDIQKVFIKELQSLLYPLAKNVNLDIILPNGITVEKIYGYENAIKPLAKASTLEPVYYSNPNQLSLSLNNFNHGLTQVVLLKCRVHSYVEQYLIQASLNFHNILTQQQESTTSTHSLKNRATVPKAFYNPLKDGEVKKNFTIAEMADALKQMAQLLQQNEHNNAQITLQNALMTARQRYPYNLDNDVERVYNILEKYSQQMRLAYKE